MVTKDTRIWKFLVLLNSVSMNLLIIFLFSSFLIFLYSTAIEAQSPPVADIFSPPLGYADGVEYGPRMTYNNEDVLIENTDYGIQNPDLAGGTCFGVPFNQILHAGEDWYREDGGSTEDAEVTAVANGEVVFDDPGLWYPGRVIILEHMLPSGQLVYSVYSHIENVPAEITNGQIVSRGQYLGTVMYQAYQGLYPEYHPSGDDSHLHFEIRYFYDASNIYTNYPACNGIIPGRGYTYPEHPDDFPAPGAGYTDPATFVQNRAGIFLPLVLKNLAVCREGGELLQNGGFESGPPGEPWVQYSNGDPELIDDYIVHSGDWGVWMGGYDNAYEEIYQEFVVPNNTSSLLVNFYVAIGSNDDPAVESDYFYVHIQDENGETLFLGEFDNTDDQWVWWYWPIPVDVSSMNGQVIRLSFLATNDDNNQVTSFWLDDATVTMSCGAGSSAASAESATSQSGGAIPPGPIDKPAEQYIGEVGYLNDTLTHNRQTVVLNHAYENPVVFAQPLSYDGGHTSVVRIADVQSDRFTLYVDEAPNKDGAHTTEAISYLVLEAGSWTLADGTRLEVGTLDTQATVGRSVSNVWEHITFSPAFPSAPVVVSQVQTENDTLTAPYPPPGPQDATWLKTRQRNVASGGFDVALEVADNHTTIPIAETIGWLAIEPGQGDWHSHPYKAGKTSDAVTHNWYQLNFGATFAQPPRFIAGIATYDGSDGSALRYKRTSLTATGVKIKIEEDTTQDSETSHTSEVIHYLVIEGDGNLTGQ